MWPEEQTNKKDKLGEIGKYLERQNNRTESPSNKQNI